MKRSLVQRASMSPTLQTSVPGIGGTSSHSPACVLYFSILLLEEMQRAYGIEDLQTAKIPAPRDIRRSGPGRRQAREDKLLQQQCQDLDVGMLIDADGFGITGRLRRIVKDSAKDTRYSKAFVECVLRQVEGESEKTDHLAAEHESLPIIVKNSVAQASSRRVQRRPDVLAGPGRCIFDDVLVRRVERVG